MAVLGRVLALVGVIGLLVTCVFGSSRSDQLEGILTSLADESAGGGSPDPSTPQVD